MQSLIIISKDIQKGLERAWKICRENKIDSLDITTIKGEKTIGIEEVRIMQKGIVLKPFKSQIKAVIIQNANILTQQAQNAMLKTLEEPPNHTLIILLVTSKELLLPTICSRCKIIELEEDNFISEKEIEKYNKLLISLLTGSIGERLKIAQDEGKTPAYAIVFLEKLMLVSRQQLIINLISPPDTQDKLVKSLRVDQYLNILISFARSHIILKTTNANPRFTLETLLLNI